MKCHALNRLLQVSYAAGEPKTTSLKTIIEELNTSVSEAKSLAPAYQIMLKLAHIVEAFMVT